MDANQILKVLNNKHVQFVIQRSIELGAEKLKEIKNSKNKR